MEKTILFSFTESGLRLLIDQERKKVSKKGFRELKVECLSYYIAKSQGKILSGTSILIGLKINSEIGGPT
jgi:hypothetical protein